MFSRCPKCGHAPLPADQSLPAACPACGVILAKLAMVPAGSEPAVRAGRRTAPADDAEGPQPGWLARLAHVPPRVDAVRWWLRVALLAGFGLWGLWLISMDFRDGSIAQSFVHGPLLVFHEAGHVVFMLFGEWMTIAGGTLGQLLMPAILGGALLLKNRDPFGAAIGLWLLGVSLLDVAPYVYDALVPQLTLLGGHTGEDGPHDWIYLLGSMGLLKKAQGLGNLVHKLGALVVLVALAWGAWLLKRQHARIDDKVLFEE
ncbi:MULTISPECIES: zinc ribbon domain-containing protein [unclassified Rhizobacter]|uniref:zinc ribbon domain-containing protein n=1 Tax=unclassified Rhizobacter TaxID=2640088 RepID=UPI000AC91B66|nr:MULTISPECIES: zinc ribbon domain-containing protein [unclassified Rhizobacter]